MYFLHTLIIPVILSCSTPKMAYQGSADSLNILSVTNKEIIPIINVIIDKEKHCDYYSSDLLFSIHFQASNSETTVQRASVGNRKIQIGDEQGCLMYRGHLFIVSGENLDNSVFKRTDEKKIVKWYVPYENNKKATDKPVLDVIEDDSFSIWLFKYESGKFTLMESSSNCK